MMKFKSLEIFPKGESGWSMEKIDFADHITQLVGPNGCGKTPVMQSIIYALGYPCVFRKDIYERCSHCELIIEVNGEEYRIERQYINKAIEVVVTEPNLIVQEFFNESDYSHYLFDLLGYSNRNLISNKGYSVTPYVATFLPLIYLDQDEGYSSVYKAPSSFIKDQYIEMTRMFFNLPIKNSYIVKKEKVDLGNKLQIWDRRVSETQNRIQVLAEVVRESSLNSDEIEKLINSYNEELLQIKNEDSSHVNALEKYDKLILNYRIQIRKTEGTIQDVKDRINSFNKIIEDIDSEICTLNLNEEAKRVFKSFPDICSSPTCKLFSVSSENYSKNLLYLKDQIKDLEYNNERDLYRIQQRNAENRKSFAKIVELEKEKDALNEDSEIQATSNAIVHIKNEIYELQIKLAEIKILNEQRLNFTKEMEQRNNIYLEYNSLKSSTEKNTALSKIQSKIRKKYIDWLDILSTENVSRDIELINEFTPEMGSEKISQLKGSTRIRAVLAFHAALLEANLLSLRNKNSFLILDTPKQHEIHSKDLDNYMNRLKLLAEHYGIQIIFSTTEYRYDSKELDKNWEPKYNGENQLMFLSDPSYN